MQALLTSGNCEQKEGKDGLKNSGFQLAPFNSFCYPMLCVCGPRPCKDLKVSVSMKPNHENGAEYSTSKGTPLLVLACGWRVFSRAQSASHRCHHGPSNLGSSFCPAVCTQSCKVGSDLYFLCQTCGTTPVKAVIVGLVRFPQTKACANHVYISVGCPLVQAAPWLRFWRSRHDFILQPLAIPAALWVQGINWLLLSDSR